MGRVKQCDDLSSEMAGLSENSCLEVAIFLIGGFNILPHVFVGKMQEVKGREVRVGVAWRISHGRLKFICGD